ncbi:MAG TPA: diacylglycerol kinase [Segeticoccus sp.]|uniref:diacylglycerol kinase n=1 Tax=Segeticoccus sp. TaxID=2706531 RepID=UPI002D810325|nr:diacylglycerol kinase [Segeticoccus sp.]HET8598942.1 diacylglycerol kinase [Segeticoccus sp.]
MSPGVPGRARRVAVLVNPTSGVGRGARAGAEVSARLRAAELEVLDVSEETAEAAHQHAREAVQAGVDVLVVVGGDGMVHLGADVCAGTDCALGVVAAGTGNDVARALGLPVHDLRAAAEVIARGVPRPVDLGRHTDREGRAHWFAGVLAAGFDALVTERANQLRWPRGRLRYLLAVARELPVFRPMPYRVTVDGREVQTEAMLVAVGNGPAYGGGLQICPEARWDDGLLDVLVVRPVSVPELLRVLPRVFRGTHLSHPAVQLLRGQQVEVAGPELMTYADGERFRPLPLTCEAVPAAVRVVLSGGSRHRAPG